MIHSSSTPRASGDSPKPVIPWTRVIEVLFVLGVLGQTAYLSEPAKQVMSVWLFIPIVMLPFVIILLFQRGMFSDEVVERAHLLGALWYMALTLVVIVMAIGGYRPHGWIAFLVMIAPGAVIALWLIQRWLRDTPSLSAR